MACSANGSLAGKYQKYNDSDASNARVFELMAIAEHPSMRRNARMARKAGPKNHFLGEWLRFRGVIHRELAAEIGKEQQSVTRYANRKRGLPTDAHTLATIYRVLDIDRHQLFNVNPLADARTDPAEAPHVGKDGRIEELAESTPVSLPPTGEAPTPPQDLEQRLADLERRVAELHRLFVQHSQRSAEAWAGQEHATSELRTEIKAVDVSILRVGNQVGDLQKELRRWRAPDDESHSMLGVVSG